MISRSAAPVSIPVSFDAGFPDANVAYTVYDQTGAVLSTSALTPLAGAVSSNILVSSALNTLAAGSYLGYRDVAWTYTTGGVVVNGEQRYTLQARLPYGISPDGVRSKLGGISAVDLPDSDIELVSAYLAFQALATPAVLAAATGDRALVSIKDGAEALAAYALIPTMTVRVAAKESNGTNAFQRQVIDWSAVSDSLQGIVDAALSDLITGYDVTADDLPLFVLASPSVDAITNA